MKTCNSLISAAIAVATFAAGASAAHLSETIYGAPRHGTSIETALSTDEGVPQRMISAMKADEGVPQGMVTAMKADEGVPANLVTAMRADEGVPQAMIVAMKTDEGVPQNLATS